MLDCWRGNGSAAYTIHREDGFSHPVPVAEAFHPRRPSARWSSSLWIAARGRVLDVGAGVGRHSLALQERGHAVTLLNWSRNSSASMSGRGVRDALAGFTGRCVRCVNHAPHKKQMPPQLRASSRSASPLAPPAWWLSLRALSGFTRHEKTTLSFHLRVPHSGLHSLFAVGCSPRRVHRSIRIFSTTSGPGDFWMRITHRSPTSLACS